MTLQEELFKLVAVLITTVVFLAVSAAYMIGGETLAILILSMYVLILLVSGLIYKYVPTGGVIVISGDEMGDDDEDDGE